VIVAWHRGFAGSTRFGLAGCILPFWPPAETPAPAGLQGPDSWHGTGLRAV